MQVHKGVHVVVRTTFTMIIVVRCFTCGKVLADKWDYYEQACKELTEGAAEGAAQGAVEQEQASKSGRGKILDRLQLDRICCRRHFLGHVDMMDVI
jgi:DNA-directed RNA polymerase I, II, and III subunit RPABC5